MISLLLTLFISLFSICPSYSKVEVHNENNVLISQSCEPKGLTHNEGAYTYLFTNLDLCSSRFFENCYVRSPSWFDSHSSTPYYYYNLRASYVYFTYLNCEDISATQVVYSISYLRISYEFSEPFGTTLSDGTRPYYHYYDFKYCESDGTVRLTYRLRLFEDRHISNGQVLYQFDGALMDVFNVPNFALTVYLPYSTVLYDLCTDGSYTSDYQDGYDNGYNNGFASGENSGYQNGYAQALNDTENLDSTASTIFEGIFDVGLLPVNVFLTIFNFELFGVNIAGVVSGLLTLSVVIIIIRLLLGGKKDD